MPLHSPPATVPSTHDRQPIKYKSFRIAPAELEAMLLSHPAVADVAVVAAPDRDVGELPKALVVLRSEISGDELMAFVAERVAPYKKVRQIEFVQRIPR